MRLIYCKCFYRQGSVISVFFLASRVSGIEDIVNIARNFILGLNNLLLGLTFSHFFQLAHCMKISRKQWFAYDRWIPVFLLENCLMHLGQNSLVTIAIIGSGIKAQLRDGWCWEKLNALELPVESNGEGRSMGVPKGIGDTILAAFSEEFLSSALTGPAVGVGLVVRAHC